MLDKITSKNISTGNFSTIGTSFQIGLENKKVFHLQVCKNCTIRFTLLGSTGTTNVTSFLKGLNLYLH